MTLYVFLEFRLIQIILGGHFNPAVSLAFCSLGKLPLKHLLSYFLVQTLGAYLGAAGAYSVYYGKFNYIFILTQ